jgi:hypothetical protein
VSGIRNKPSKGRRSYIDHDSAGADDGGGGF